MKRRTILFAVGGSVLAAGVWASTAPRFEVQRLAPEEFARVHASVAPRGEKWTEIPWQTDLHEARRQAAAQKKPLLMWIMDGHPLGCT